MLLLRNFNMIFDSTSRASVRITKMSLPELTDGSIDTRKVVHMLLWESSPVVNSLDLVDLWSSLFIHPILTKFAHCYVALYYFSQICK